MLDDLIKNENVLNIYIFGSLLYGNNNNSSDIDYIVITKDYYGNNSETIEYIDDNGIKHDFNIYNESNWVEMNLKNNINCLEVFSLKKKRPDLILKEMKQFDLTIDLINLRKSISGVISNSWSKAHKKLVVEDSYNPIVAKKSLWHCFRICKFGIQICRHGYIYDFTESNNLYNLIMCEPNDWEHLKRKYQGEFNKVKTEFKILTGKEWLEYKNNENIYVENASID